MSVLTTKNSLCQGMNQGYYGVVGPPRNAIGNIDTLWNDAYSGLYVLKNTGFSSQSSLDAGVASLKASASAFYPGDQLADMQTINSFLINCGFLNGQQPVASLLAGITGIFGKIYDLISGLTSGLPEFGIGGLIGLILDLLGSLFPGGQNITNLLFEGDQLINCLVNLCGPGFAGQASAYSADLTNLYGDLHLYDSGPDQGELMLDDMYDSLSMTPTEKQKMTTVNDGILETKVEASDAINNSIVAVKSYTSGGLFA